MTLIFDPEKSLQVTSDIWNQLLKPEIKFLCSWAVSPNATCRQQYVDHVILTADFVSPQYSAVCGSNISISFKIICHQFFISGRTRSEHDLKMAQPISVILGTPAY